MYLQIKKGTVSSVLAFTAQQIKNSVLNTRLEGLMKFNRFNFSRSHVIAPAGISPRRRNPEEAL